MVATVPTRGVLKASTNRVRTSVALQGNAMWNDIIGVEAQGGGNAGVEALINAPTMGGGRKAKAAQRQAAAQAVLATGGFDTAITSYESLLTLAKSQGAVGTANRGACKVCGQLGHLTKQCRNQFSKYYDAGDKKGETDALEAAKAAAAAAVAEEESDLSDLSSESSDSDSSSEEERRRKRRRKEKRKHRSSSSHDKKKKSSKERKHRSKDKKKRSSKDKKRRRSSSSSSSESDSD